MNYRSKLQKGSKLNLTPKARTELPRLGQMSFPSNFVAAFLMFLILVLGIAEGCFSQDSNYTSLKPTPLQSYPQHGCSENRTANISASLLKLTAGHKSQTCRPASAFLTEPYGDVQESQQTIDRALKFIIAMQHKDGSWKSEYYGNLKQGAAITSLVLFAISNCDKAMQKRYQSQIKRAFEFQKIGIKKNGYASNQSGPDYAVYATSLLILAADNFASKINQQWLTDSELITLRRFLCDAQLDETHQLAEDKADFGGWDLSGWMQGPRSSPGTNVSVSSFALLALKKDQSAAAKKARARATVWMQRIHNTDGGFHFHPKKDHHGNKAGWSDESFSAPKSYGTATLDGIRILRALSQPKPKTQAAVKWIEKQPFGSFVPGFKAHDSKDAKQSHSDDSDWSQGLLYYYIMSLSLEFDCFSSDFQKRRTEIQEFLIKQQKANGSWSNPSTRMREDDPIIATCFAIVAIAQQQRAIQSDNAKRLHQK